MLLLFLILPELIFVGKKFLNGDRHKCLISEFVLAMIFHHFLGLNFVCGGVSESTSSKDL